MQWQTFAKLLANFSDIESRRIERAFLLAQEAHKEQKRKSGEPYIIHPIEVAKTLIALGADEETIIAGLLHDCPEDTNCNLSKIKDEFGEDVAFLVDGVTKILPGDIQHAPDLNSQIETVRKMIVLMEQDIRIMVVKLADRLHNMQTIAFMQPERQLSFAKETLQVYVPIADRLCMQDMRDKLANLSISVLYTEYNDEFAALIKEYEEISKKTIVTLEQDLESFSARNAVSVQKEERSYVKWLKSIEEGKKGVSSIAVVIECKSVDTCYALLGHLHQLYKREQLSFQDYINSPANNGYQGLHTTVILENGLTVRCKIRTLEMNRYALDGIAVHCFDNEAEGIQTYLTWTKQIDSLDSETKNVSEDFWETLQRDILGESLLLHRADDQVISIPQKATVLDALFYLYGEEALYASDVFADGKLVFFWQPATMGMRLLLHVDKHKTVALEWLTIVKTANASAMIKAALKKQTKDKKISIGKELLQAEFSLHNRGYLEEYALQKSALKEVSKQLFIDIAEGKILAQQAYETYFGSGKYVPYLDKPQTTVLQVTSSSKDSDEQTLLTRLMPHNVAIEEYSYKKLASGFIASIKFTANAEQIHNAEKALLTLKNAAVRNITGTLWFGMNAAALIILWTADVILAKTVLVPRFSFTDITITRFIVLTLFAIGMIVVQKTLRSSTVSLRRINPFNRKLISSSIALFSTGLCTYIALQGLTSIEYAALINLATIVSFSLAIKRERVDHILIIALAICTIVPIVWLSSTNTVYILAGLMTAVSFLTYSYFTKRYQTEQYILSRYPYFLFFIALGTVLCSSLLLPLSTLHLLSVTQLLLLSIYHVVFTSIPYVLFFQFAKRKRIESVGNLIPFFFPLVLLFDSTIHTDQIHWLFVLAFIITIAWIYRRLGFNAERV